MAIDMESLGNAISPEELFGKASRLVAQLPYGGLEGIASLGTLYQVAVAVVALLFIFIVVRYFDLFTHLIISSISKVNSRSDIHIYAAEVNNIEIITSIAGISLISLLIMRLSVMTELSHMLSPLHFLSAWQLGGVSFAAIATVVVAEYLLLLLVGIVSENREMCKGIWHIKLLHFTTTIIILSPLLILALLTEGLSAEIALWSSVAVCSISLILFIKESFMLFRTQRFSIFHWILYLCALEIFPLSLLVAPILRG